jgi:AcrR family transcriptional regulator
MPRSGRRPGAGGTREKILAAARSRFGDAGYEGSTIRGIASAAGVDPALILHYFGSKDGVFRAAMVLPFDPAAVLPDLLAPGLDGLGERLAGFFLETWESPRGESMLGVLRSVVNNPEAAALLRAFVSREVLARLAAALEVDQPELRAALAGSQLIGVAFARYVVGLEPLASAPVADVARWIGPTLQRYFTDSTPA